MHKLVDLHHILKNDASPVTTVAMLQGFWDKSVFDPWKEVSLRPSKEIRAEFVKLGWLLANSPTLECKSILNQISNVIETIHLGSLIIDDIQDDSFERRGKPTLHRMYDMPLALNLGNFLYFQAAHLINQINVSQQYKDLALKQIIEVMRDAHLGQALDITINITEVDQEKVPKLVETSLRLKSGALMKLALRLGALLNPELKNEHHLDHFGESFGSCLQKLDDVGNMKISCLNPKYLEDLKLRRPTWIWSVLSQTGTAEQWTTFIQAIEKLPCTELLESYLKDCPIKETALEMALKDLKEVTENLKNNFQLDESSEAYSLAIQLKEKLSYAY